MQDLVSALQYGKILQIMDVGASAINEVPVYKKLLDNGVAHLHAFDGDDRQIAKMKQAYGESATVHNAFLYDGTEQNLYLCSEASGMTSVLKPRLSALRFFNGFEIFGSVQREARVQTSTLDSLAAVPHIDFLKMDVQGAELTILKNGGSKLQNCLAIQLEISFVCLYENQPGFGEIDLWMRSHGYTPHQFLEMKRWSIAPTVFDGNFRIPGNQLLEADIVYIKDPVDPEAITSDQLKALCLLSHYCFKSYDLCGHLILELERRNVMEKGSYGQYLSSALHIH